MDSGLHGEEMPWTAKHPVKAPSVSGHFTMETSCTLSQKPPKGNDLAFALELQQKIRPALPTNLCARKVFEHTHNALGSTMFSRILHVWTWFHSLFLGLNRGILGRFANAWPKSYWYRGYPQISSQPCNYFGFISINQSFSKVHHSHWVHLFLQLLIPLRHLWDWYGSELITANVSIRYGFVHLPPWLEYSTTQRKHKETMKLNVDVCIHIVMAHVSSYFFWLALVYSVSMGPACRDMSGLTCEPTG